MNRTKVGIITYDCSHLKTEQLLLRLINDLRIESITLFALPFVNRKKRHVIFNHRPDMNSSIKTKDLSQLNKVDFRLWDGKKHIHDDCDIFIISGSGILDTSFAKHKKIINVHPGIIPLVRGLDAFKWAILNNHPLGNTLHIINQEVDKGEILMIKYTPIFSSDTISTIAHRHYELELNLLTNFLDYLDNRIESFHSEKPPTMRMNNHKENKMIQNFDNWKSLIMQSNLKK